jgi:hypothetical protein
MVVLEGAADSPSPPPLGPQQWIKRVVVEGHYSGRSNKASSSYPDSRRVWFPFIVGFWYINSDLEIQPSLDWDQNILWELLYGGGIQIMRRGPRLDIDQSVVFRLIKFEKGLIDIQPLFTTIYRAVADHSIHAYPSKACCRLSKDFPTFFLQSQIVVVVRIII